MNFKREDEILVVFTVRHDLEEEDEYLVLNCGEIELEIDRSDLQDLEDNIVNSFDELKEKKIAKLKESIILYKQQINKAELDIQKLENY